MGNENSEKVEVDKRTVAEERLSGAMHSLTDAAKSEMNEVFFTARQHMHRIAAEAKMEAKSAADSVFEIVSGKIRDVKSQMDVAEAVRKNPGTALSVAAGTGAILGFALHHRATSGRIEAQQAQARPGTHRVGQLLKLDSPWARLALDVGFLMLQKRLNRSAASSGPDLTNNR